MNSAIVYAFGVGMVATFNPCGFAMLPAYLSYFLGLENARDTDNRADATVLRALAVGAAMTAGFVVVFGVLGLVGAVTKIYFTYRSEMEHHEANGPWAQR
jgi:cytochrome c biogenesis protein CcdA